MVKVKTTFKDFLKFRKLLLYSQTCVKRPYKARHIRFGFLDRWLLIAA